MKRKTLVFLLVLALSAAPALADVIGPTDVFYVNDAADVLSDDTEAYIVRGNDWLYALFGAQIVIVTLDTTGEAWLDEYAFELFNEWGIGSAGKDNGLLLIMAVGDDDYWLSVGAGYDRFLTDDAVGWLLYDALEPHFAAKDYDAGARALFDALSVRVTAYETVTTLLRGLSRAFSGAAS